METALKALEKLKCDMVRMVIKCYGQYNLEDKAEARFNLVESKLKELEEKENE